MGSWEVGGATGSWVLVIGSGEMVIGSGLVVVGLVGVDVVGGAATTPVLICILGLETMGATWRLAALVGAAVSVVIFS